MWDFRFLTWNYQLWISFPSPNLLDSHFYFQFEFLIFIFVFSGLEFDQGGLSPVFLNLDFLGDFQHYWLMSITTHLISARNVFSMFQFMSKVYFSHWNVVITNLLDQQSNSLFLHFVIFGFLFLRSIGLWFLTGIVFYLRIEIFPKLNSDANFQ